MRPSREEQSCEEEQVYRGADFLRVEQAETGTPVAEVIRRMGISEQTFYRWRKLYGGLGTGELRRLKQLEDENRKLKQLVAISASTSTFCRMCCQQSSDA